MAIALRTLAGTHLAGMKAGDEGLRRVMQWVSTSLLRASSVLTVCGTRNAAQTVLFGSPARAYNDVLQLQDISKLCPWHGTHVLAKDAECDTFRAALINQQDGLYEVCTEQQGGCLNQ